MPSLAATASMSDFNFSVILMVADSSVINHTSQAETYHSRLENGCGKVLSMDENTAFRENLLSALAESGMSEAELSVKAGLNRRAVTDIREGRVRSPKLSTVFALSRALGIEPGEMMGLGKRPRIRAGLADLLSQYDEDGQAQLEAAIQAFPVRPASGQ